jgi:hypothetical protein
MARRRRQADTALAVAIGSRGDPGQLPQILRDLEEAPAPPRPQSLDALKAGLRSLKNNSATISMAEYRARMGTRK